MPVFEYTALDQKSKKIKGVIDAGSINHARQKLREMEVFLVDIKETASVDKEKSGDKIAIFPMIKKVRLRDLSIMTRQLSTLLSAGLPLVPSLNALASQTKHPQFKIILTQIKDQVTEGNSLTLSMSNFPDVFPPLYVNMIRAGEASGTLDIVLDRLADFYEKSQALRTKIRSALAYPILMFFIGSGVLMFMLAFVVPNITKIFQEMHQNLPMTTIMLIAVSNALKTYWLLILILMVGSILFIRYSIKSTVRGAHIWNKFKISAPVIGELNRNIAISRFSRTLGTLLKSDVPLLTALEIVSHVVGNSLIAAEIRQAIKDVGEGQSLSVPLSKSGLFPTIAIEMIAIGEQSGTVEEMLLKIADSLERDVEANILVFTSLLEPIMIVSMGLIVGFIIISILLPIFEMNQLIK